MATLDIGLSWLSVSLVGDFLLDAGRLGEFLVGDPLLGEYLVGDFGLLTRSWRALAAPERAPSALLVALRRSFTCC